MAAGRIDDALSLYDQHADAFRANKDPAPDLAALLAPVRRSRGVPLEQSLAIGRAAGRAGMRAGAKGH